MRTKPILITCTVLLLLSCDLSAQNKNYYLSASGDDAHDGLSRQTAWRSLDRMKKVDFKEGDSILLEGGAIFKGTIHLTSSDNGSAGKPVMIASYGTGKAVIDAGEGEGLLAINTSYLKLSSLSFIGAGVNRSKSSGIHFYANDSVSAPSHIEITDCDVKGFTMYGIVFEANDKISIKGYDQVRITHCNVSENGEGGIGSYGSHMGYQHQNFYIAYCKAFSNRGKPSKTQNHSGNGIVMGMIDGLLIEFCEAFENGSDNRCTGGGPVGIWVWMCRNAVIQYCSSHDNYAGLTKDGGGFDIDGGSFNCIIQYNYSYNNEGAGYLLAEYGAVLPFTNNIIRFNISINDGRKNSYGAISVWGAAKDFSVTNSYIYNNTIFLDDKKIVAGIPAGITLLGANFRNVVMANNIIVTKGIVNIINADTTINASAFLLLHNNYYSYTNQYSFQWGKRKIHSLRSWFELNPDQEKWQGKSLFLNQDPMFKNLQLLRSLSTTKEVEHFQKEGLLLLSASLLRKKLFPLSDHFKILSNTKDYCNNDLPLSGQIMPGAIIR